MVGESRSKWDHNKGEKVNVTMVRGRGGEGVEGVSYLGVQLNHHQGVRVGQGLAFNIYSFFILPKSLHW